MDQNLNLTSLDLGVELDSLDPDNLDYSFFEPLAEDGTTAPDAAGPGTTTASSASRPYHSKRPHKKSRAGCKNCKARKVKCNEGRPSCRACTLRKEKCVYPESAPVSYSPASSTAGGNSPARSQGDGGSSGAPSPQHHSAGAGYSSGAMVISEPMFYPAGVVDPIDMKMLWFYTAETYRSFNVQRGPGVLDHVLRVKIPELAFQSPFLMQTLMGLSALQLKTLHQDVPAQKAASYRAKAFQGYREAIEAAKPEDYPALLAGSLFICALSSEMFREADTKPLYIIDWMTVWRGIGLIVNIVSPTVLIDSGLAVLFYRPPIDLNKATRHIPNNLLFMVTSIRPGDDDFEHQQIYYDALRYLGSLYEELEKGFSPLMDLRIVTFFTFIPREFIPLAKEHRPRALVILAHYCSFTKLPRGPWWMASVGDKQIRQINELIGDSWEHLMRIPRRVMYQEDLTEIAQTILQNNHWTAPEQDLYQPETRDPRLKRLTFISQSGVEAKIIDGEWRIQAPRIAMQQLQLDDAVSELQSQNMYSALESGTARTIDSNTPSTMSESGMSTPSPAAHSVASSNSTGSVSSP